MDSKINLVRFCNNEAWVWIKLHASVESYYYLLMITPERDKNFFLVEIDQFSLV